MSNVTVRGRDTFVARNARKLADPRRHIQRAYDPSARTVVERPREKVADRNELALRVKAALDTAGTGSYLLGYDLYPELVDALYDRTPLLQFIETAQATSKVHEYRTRLTYPRPVFQGEGASASSTSGTYGTGNVTLKIARGYPEVTGFLEATSKSFADALIEELAGAVHGIGEFMEYSLLWANDVDTYQVKGLAEWLEADATAKVSNIFDHDGTVTLTLLDNMLNAVKLASWSGDAMLWLMSTSMAQKVSTLQTRANIQLSPGQPFEGAMVMNTYGNIPILEADYVTPRTTSPAVSASASESGGTLGAAYYYYAISTVDIEGEQFHGTASSRMTISGSTGSVALTWTGDASAQLYRVYRSVGDTLNTADDLKLIKVIAAKTYDGSGNVTGLVESFTDTGYTAISTVHPLASASNDSTIWLVNTEADRGLTMLGNIDDDGRPIAEMWRLVELARTKDSFPMMLKIYFANLAKYPTAHAIARRVRVS